MGRYTGKLLALAALLQAGHHVEVERLLRRWLHSTSLSYGFRRDLTRPFVAPQARVPISVRPMRKWDELELLDVHASDLSGEAMYHRIQRRQFIEAGIPTGYVAVMDDGRPCFMQFLILPAHNAELRAYFGGFFPPLAPDEALLEHSFTLPAVRGMGIMTHAMAQIAERGRELGARWAISFVDHDNVPSLRGHERAGFSLYLVRRESWRLFRRRVSFEEPCAATSLSWDQH